MLGGSGRAAPTKPIQEKLHEECELRDSCSLFSSYSSPSRFISILLSTFPVAINCYDKEDTIAKGSGVKTTRDYP